MKTNIAVKKIFIFPLKSMTDEIFHSALLRNLRLNDFFRGAQELMEKKFATSN